VFAGFRNLTLQKAMVVIDLETTGTDPLHDRIVEVAAIRCDLDGRTSRRRQRVNPCIPIPPAATAVHGITDSDVAGAPTFAELAPKLAAFVGRDSDLAGFNLRKFDLLILMSEFDRAGLRMPMAGRSVVDAYELFLRQEPRTLAAAVKRYLGTEAAASHAIAAHGALADAAAAAAVLDRILAADPELPITPAALQRLCGWADATGRFRIVRGPGGEETVVFAFGKHRGRPLVEVARDDESYLRWMLAIDFAEDACELVRVALGEPAN
jgi:DNA polymerase-3 subunit epsilon